MRELLLVTFIISLLVQLYVGYYQQGSTLLPHKLWASSTGQGIPDIVTSRCRQAVSVPNHRNRAVFINRGLSGQHHTGLMPSMWVDFGLKN